MPVPRVARLFGCIALLSGSIFGQTTTGTLLGTVADPGDAAVQGARVELTNKATGSVVTATTGAEGIFRFNSLVPATYNLTIKPASGFKTYSQSNIAVTANEVRDLGKIVLMLGALTENVSVVAEVTPVQTASAENSKLVDSAQMTGITLKGRDLFGLLAIMPGVATAQQDTTSENSIGSVRINGGIAGLANFTVDGIVDTDTANNTTLHYEPNMDSIAEMRVLTANYQAEYGRNSSGTISVVTRSGSQQFHGAGWANKRHEMFNAKSFFQNFNGQPKSIYRFFVWGYRIGGPVYVPKVFNTEKKKLFFFFSQEYTKQKPATQSGYANVPTLAQRAGDFSGYTDANGVSYPIYDPTTGNPVPNNNIAGLASFNPTAAKAGQAILNFFPLPNICGHQGVDPSHCIQDAQYATQQYSRNYYWQFNESHPRRNDTFRVDYNVTSKLNTWVRYINDYDMDYTGGNIELKNSQGAWVPWSNEHPNPGHGYGVGITYTISPSLINEFTFGKSYNSWDYYAHDQSQTDRSMMANPPSFDNFANDPLFTGDGKKQKPAGLGTGALFYQMAVPNISFGGGQEPNEVSFSPSCSGQCPYTNWNDVYSFNDSLSKVIGTHNLKAGVYYEKTGKVEVGSGSQGQYLGNYNFASSTAMPNNTQDGFANAFLGNFNTYSEGGRSVGDFWYSEVEFFLQDNWRVSRRVTLDLGVRFSHVLPTANLNKNNAAWLRTSYDPAKAERIYLPGCTVSTAARACPTANQVAVDPVTGYTTFFALQGTLVPVSVGGYSATPSPTPGMEVATGSNPNLPLDMYTHSALIPALRFGLAWDVFGNGRTAIRTGFGQFENLTDSHFAQLASGNPPVTINRTIYYSSIDKVPSFANTAAITPIAPQATIGKQPVQSNYNGTFMIQQKVPFGTVVETSYVFNLSKHTWVTHQLNPVAPYSEYDPAHNNPTVDYLPANTSGKALSDNYFRPLPGLGALTYNDLSGNSSFHSLQVSVRRAMSRHLSYGLAYTFSKTMSAYGGYPSTVNAYFPDKFRNYGPSYQPTPHVIAVNYIYELPNPGEKLKFKPLGWVTDHWALSGITQWRSDIMVGVPGISFTGTTSTNPQMNWTGGTELARMMVVGNPQLPSGQVSFAGATPLVQAPGANANGTPGNQILNESVFAIPFPCSWTPGPTPQQGVGKSMSCYGNAGPGSIIPLPNTRTFNNDVTFTKVFPLKGERRLIMFRAEAYNVFNHTQFTGANITPSYSWPLWQTGVLQQTNASLGRYTSAANPRQMSLSLRVEF
jgi:hypothetical protein